MFKFYLEMNEAKIIKFVRNINNKYSKNDINELEKILNNKELDPTVNYYAVMRMASRNGHYEIVKLLIHDLKIDPSIYDNYAICTASEHGHLKVVELLLNDERVDPSADNNCATRMAAEYGHLEIVKLLLKDKRVDPGACNNFAIRWALRNSHFEIVKLFLNNLKFLKSLTIEFIKEYNLVESFLKYLNLKSEEELENYLKII
jgi:ankyrin repeat protein